MTITLTVTLTITIAIVTETTTDFAYQLIQQLLIPPAKGKNK